MRSTKTHSKDCSGQSADAQTVTVSRDRKAEHIRLALEERMQVADDPFAAYSFVHNALPEIDLETIDLSTRFLGKRLEAPILISCMTGGTEMAAAINANLAAAAERCGVAFGVGSQRKALEDPETAATFHVRSLMPSVPLLANLGAVQLNYGCGVDECRRVVEMIEADALVFHLNPLQEAIQPEGQGRFSGLVAKMGDVAEQLSVPVIAKEIGCGLSASVGRLLRDVGIRILDTAGVGGTSWARIEAARADDLEIGERFAGWGISTPDSIRQLETVGGVDIIASGGLRTGIEAAKALALGACLVGMAYPFLRVATESAEAVVEAIERIKRELRITLFCVGARRLDDLHRVPLLFRGEPMGHG